MSVTLAVVNGFSFGRPVWYISMDASIPLAAAIEHNTYAPLMGKLLLGNDDSAGSPIERIFIATNGMEGCDNPSVKDCRLTWPMDTGRTTLWEAFQRSLSITARPGTRTCTRGLTRQFPRAIASNFVKNSRFSPMRKTA